MLGRKWESGHSAGSGTRFVIAHLKPENRPSPSLKRRRSIPGPLSMLPMCGVRFVKLYIV